MRLRTLGAVCVTSAVAVPLIDVVPPASAQEATPPAQPAAAPPGQPAAVPPGDMQAAAVATLANRHVYFARRYHRLLGDRLSLSERRAMRQQVAQLDPATLRAKTRDLRGDIRSLRRKLDRKLNGGAPDVPIPPQLSSIAQCESHGDPHAVSAGGTYRGKYQFSFATWQSVGGKGDPAAASETEQDRRAAVLYRIGGPGHWPVCGV
jgi:transglycosylase-like protein